MNELERGLIMLKFYIIRIYCVYIVLFEKKIFFVFFCYKKFLFDEDKKVYVFIILIFEKFDCFFFCF